MWPVNRSDTALMKITECYYNIKNTSCEITWVHLETKQTNLQEHQFLYMHWPNIYSSMLTMSSVNYKADKHECFVLKQYPNSPAGVA